MTEFAIVILKNELYAFEKIGDKFEILKIKGEVSVDLSDCKSPSELAERIIRNYIQDKVVNADLKDVNINVAYSGGLNKFLTAFIKEAEYCNSITVYPIEKELVNILLKLNIIKPGTSAQVKIDDTSFKVSLEETGKNIIEIIGEKVKNELKAEDIANSFIANYKFISNQKEIEKLQKDVKTANAEIKRLSDKLKKYGIPTDLDESKAMTASYDSKTKDMAGKVLKAVVNEVKTSGAKLICDKNVEIWVSFTELKKYYGDNYLTVLKNNIELSAYFKDGRTVLITE